MRSTRVLYKVRSVILNCSDRMIIEFAIFILTSYFIFLLSGSPSTMYSYVFVFMLVV